jgi:hypothetical protein
MYKIIQIQTQSNMIVAHIKLNSKYYCVGDDGYSVMIFKGDEGGNIVSWIELAKFEGKMLNDVVRNKSSFRTCLLIGQKMS